MKVLVTGAKGFVAKQSAMATLSSMRFSSTTSTPLLSSLTSGVKTATLSLTLPVSTVRRI